MIKRLIKKIFFLYKPIPIQFVLNELNEMPITKKYVEILLQRILRLEQENNQLKIKLFVLTLLSLSLIVFLLLNILK